MWYDLCRAGKGQGETERFPLSQSFGGAAISAARRRRRDLKRGHSGETWFPPEGASEASDATEVAVEPQLAK